MLCTQHHSYYMQKDAARSSGSLALICQTTGLNSTNDSKFNIDMISASGIPLLIILNE